MSNEQQCLFGAHYQFFREFLFSLEKQGTFVLLSDQRSPVFNGVANGENRGLIPFLMEFIPDALKNRFVSVSVQEMVKLIKRSNKHIDWIEPFERKYGLAGPEGQ